MIERENRWPTITLNCGNNQGCQVVGAKRDHGNSNSHEDLNHWPRSHLMLTFGRAHQTHHTHRQSKEND